MVPGRDSSRQQRHGQGVRESCYHQGLGRGILAPPCYPLQCRCLLLSTPWSPLPPGGVSAIKAMASQAESSSLQVQPKEEKLPSAPLARVLRHFSILPSCPCFPWSSPRTLWQQGGFRCGAHTDAAGLAMQLCPWEQSPSVPSKLWGSGQCSVWGWGLSWLC